MRIGQTPRRESYPPIDSLKPSGVFLCRSVTDFLSCPPAQSVVKTKQSLAVQPEKDSSTAKAPPDRHRSTRSTRQLVPTGQRIFGTAPQGKRHFERGGMTANPGGLGAKPPINKNASQTPLTFTTGGQMVTRKPLSGATKPPYGMVSQAPTLGRILLHLCRDRL